MYRRQWRTAPGESQDRGRNRSPQGQIPHDEAATPPPLRVSTTRHTSPEQDDTCLAYAKRDYPFESALARRLIGRKCVDNDRRRECRQYKCSPARPSRRRKLGSASPPRSTAWILVAGRWRFIEQQPI